MTNYSLRTYHIVIIWTAGQFLAKRYLLLFKAQTTTNDHTIIQVCSLLIWINDIFWNIFPSFSLYCFKKTTFIKVRKVLVWRQFILKSSNHVTRFHVNRACRNFLWKKIKPAEGDFLMHGTANLSLRDWIIWASSLALIIHTRLPFGEWCGGGDYTIRHWAPRNWHSTQILQTSGQPPCWTVYFIHTVYGTRQTTTLQA